MKIIQINAVYENLSTGRICFDIHNFLVDRGIECKTIYGLNKKKYNDALYMGNLFDHKLNALMGRLTGKYYYYSNFYTNKLLRYLDKEKPDIVHLHNLHSNFVNISKLLKFLSIKNINTVVTLHDCFFYTGQCCHYTMNNCYKWKVECKKCQFNKQTWFFDRTKKMFNDKKNYFNDIKNLYIVGVSEWIINEAKQSPVFNNANVYKKIYNGIDLKIFNKQNVEFKMDNRLQNKKIILGVASKWNNNKGLILFTELSQMIDDNESIILVGNIENEIINDKIINIPMTNNVSELVKIYNAADVFVQASKEETFGNVVAESLACGTPVVTNKNTANPELVNDKCGIVVNDFNVENVYNAIKQILMFGKEHYSENCIKFAKENFDNEKNLNEYLNLYKKITKE